MGMKFVIGLTDQEDPSAFIDAPPIIESGVNVTSYNLYKQVPELEKDTIEWELNTKLPALKAAITEWESLIRRPHLNMISRREREVDAIPGSTDFILHFEFVNLLPVSSDRIPFTDADFDELASATKFGDLTMSYFNTFLEAGYEYWQTLGYAVAENTLDYLLDGPLLPVAVPYFEIEFALRRQPTVNKKFSPYEARWLADHNEALAAKGYDINAKSTNFGKLIVGKLLGDSWEQYQKLQKYSRVCRTSIVLTEE